MGCKSAKLWGLRRKVEVGILDENDGNNDEHDGNDNDDDIKDDDNDAASKTMTRTTTTTKPTKNEATAATLSFT